MHVQKQAIRWTSRDSRFYQDLVCKKLSTGILVNFKQILFVNPCFVVVFNAFSITGKIATIHIIVIGTLSLICSNSTKTTLGVSSQTGWPTLVFTVNKIRLFIQDSVVH